MPGDFKELFMKYKSIANICQNFIKGSSDELVLVSH